MAGTTRPTEAVGRTAEGVFFLTKDLDPAWRPGTVFFDLATAEVKVLDKFPNLDAEKATVALDQTITVYFDPVHSREELDRLMKGMNIK